MERVKQLLAFLQEIEKFKVLERKTFTSNVARRESDAEHSWHLAMFVWLFSSEFKKEVDLLKVLKLALVHDLVELYAGDPLPFDQSACVGKVQREDAASARLCAQLPPDLGTEFQGLYLEYRDLLSEEARIVKAYDKVQPIWQNFVSGGKAWKELHISLVDVKQLAERHVRDEDGSWRVYEQIMREVQRLHLLGPDDTATKGGASDMVG